MSIGPTGRSPLIVQIVGYKNTGKTTLVCKLIERFKADGHTVATIKHDAHDYEIDHPGTDTWKQQQAGADMTAISSPYRAAWLSASPLSLDELIARMTGADVILIEGFKSAPHPKVVLLQRPEDLSLLQLPGVIAAACRDEARELPIPAQLPAFRLDDPDALYRFLHATAP